MGESIKIFITGTGTGVGKSFVTGAIAHGFLQQSRQVSYWKPVQAGTVSPDAQMVQGLTGDRLNLLPTRFTFKTPASPDQAARQEDCVAATCDELQRAYEKLDPDDILLIEGAGGLEVPLNDEAETWSDFLANSDFPVVLVAESGLGTLNHTALSVYRLEQRGITVTAVILNGKVHTENEKSLRRMFPHLAIYSFPYMLNGKADSDWPYETLNLSQAIETFWNAGASNFKKQQWLESDLKHVWHPYTQHKNAPTPLAIKGAKGVWLELQDGQKLLDGTSSWWVNNIGHGRKEIGQAIANQQAKLDHVIFAGATHEGAATLAKELCEETDHTFSRVFYSDNGSTAIEVALKIAYQSWANRGEKQRTNFLAFQGGYHGDTFGTMAVAQTSAFHQTFTPFLFKALFATAPTMHSSVLCPDGSAEYEKRHKDLRSLLEKNDKSIAAVVIEPLVQGAGGMLIHSEKWLNDLSALCREFSLPLIFDEVFTGFGRVGGAFAYKRTKVKPDVICLAKGLTGGNLPLAVTLTSEKFFNDFLGDDKITALLHGHSYTANPIACAAALASLSIFRNEGLAEKGLWLEERYRDWIHSHEATFKIQNPRAIGGILAFELPGTSVGNYFHPKAAEIPNLARRHGLFLRPLGNTLYFAPPLVIRDDELDFSLNAIAATLRDL